MLIPLFLRRISRHISIQFFAMLFLIGSLTLADTLVSKSGLCHPNVTFYSQNYSQDFCLNEYTPENDSCADLEFDFSKSNGVKVRFKCNSDHKWTYDTIFYTDTTKTKHVKATMTTDQTGFIESMEIFMGSSEDTQNVRIQRNFDIILPTKEKTPPNIFSVGKYTYFCKQLITERKFKYPVGYMRREPIYNYPELKMFHYGSGVHMPTAGSLCQMTVEMNYYHVLHPCALQYEETPHKPIREEKVRKPRNHFFKFRPIE